MGIECPGGAAVAAGSPADPQVDAARRQRVQHPELLGHLEGRVVRQHHPRAADAHVPGAHRQGGQQDLRRGADDGGQPVVFADPEALVTQRLAVLGQIERVADGIVLAEAGPGRRLVEHRQAQGGAAGHLQCLSACGR
jgi:hypothetical protein